MCVRPPSFLPLYICFFSSFFWVNFWPNVLSKYLRWLVQAASSQLATEKKKKSFFVTFNFFTKLEIYLSHSRHQQEITPSNERLTFCWRCCSCWFCCCWVSAENVYIYVDVRALFNIHFQLLLRIGFDVRAVCVWSVRTKAESSSFFTKLRQKKKRKKIPLHCLNWSLMWS